MNPKPSPPGTQGPPTRPPFTKESHLARLDGRTKSGGELDALAATADLCDYDPVLKPGEAAEGYAYWTASGSKAAS